MTRDEFKQTDAYKQTYEYKLSQAGEAWDKLINERIKAFKDILLWKK